jgi:hypothetical protein
LLVCLAKIYFYLENLYKNTEYPKCVGKLALLDLPLCRLVGRGKTKCANVGWLNFKIFCAVAKKIKHEALGCRVGKKSAFKFICRPVVSILSFSLMVVVSSATLAYNGLQAGAGGI